MDHQGERVPEGTDRGLVGVAIPAAGTGTRMGGVRKAFLELEGTPVLLWALQAFLDHPRVADVIVALRPEDLDEPPEWLRNLGPRVRLVRGGESRGESVRAALSALPVSVEVVAIHDGARPLISREIIDRCLECVSDQQGAVAGWPAIDTLKEVGELDRIVATLPRARVWHAQTPQVFPRDLIVRAYQLAEEQGVVGTDDAALVERIGGKVVMVRGSASNLKVTHPEDLPLAEFYLRSGRG